MEADKDGDGKLSFQEFANMVANTVRPQSVTYPNQRFSLLFSLLLTSFSLGHRETNDIGRSVLSLYQYLPRILFST